MKKFLIIIAILFTGLILISFDRTSNHVRMQRKPDDSASLAAERLKMIKVLMDSLKGKKGMAADSVFTNLRVFIGPERLPVRHFLGVMYYWGESLGVGCKYCHASSSWASDSLRTKRIARNMYTIMVQTINNQIIPKISELASQPAGVNCVTCHNGHAIPK